MSRTLVCSIGMLGALAVSAAAQPAPSPGTPWGPTPVPEGADKGPDKGSGPGTTDGPAKEADNGADKAAGARERDTGRAPPPRLQPADEPAVLRPSPAGSSDDGEAASSGGQAGAPPSATNAPAAPEDDEQAGTADTAREPAASGPPAAESLVEVRPSVQWEPFGYLRAQWVGVRQDDDVAFVGRSDGFSLQNARVGVRGGLGERVRFELSLDGAVDERERVNTPNGRLRVGLRDAFVDLRELAPELIPLPVGLSLRVGRFEAWFDPDGHDGDTERAFVDRALESHGVSATEGWETSGLPPGRSIGVAAHLRFWPKRESGALDGALDGTLDDALQLLGEVAVMNGADEFASGNDNDALALAAALRLVKPERGWLQAAVRRNPRTEGDLPFQQEEVDTAFSLGGGVAVGPVTVAGGGVLQYTRFSTTGGPRQRAWGAHGQAMVRVLRGARPLDAGYRFAALDPSSLVVTDRLMEHTAGLVLGLEALRARLQLNVTHAVEQEARQLSNDRAELLLELRL